MMVEYMLNITLLGWAFVEIGSFLKTTIVIISFLISFLHFLGEKLFLSSQYLHQILVFESEYTSFLNTDTGSRVRYSGSSLEILPDYVEKYTLLLRSQTLKNQGSLERLDAISTNTWKKERAYLKQEKTEPGVQKKNL